jgi:hypothetical protein
MVFVAKILFTTEKGLMDFSRSEFALREMVNESFRCRVKTLFAIWASKLHVKGDIGGE